jgi:hypothetical protein
MWWGVGLESGSEGVLVLKVSDYVSGSLNSFFWTLGLLARLVGCCNSDGAIFVISRQSLITIFFFPVHIVFLLH